MFIQLDGQIIYYEKCGEGDPLILLHGNGEDHTIFDGLIEAAAASYTVYAPDTRGHGQSATPPGDVYHYEDFARDLDHFLDALSLDRSRSTILGFSDGAVTALLYALGPGASAKRLILCGANLSPKGLTRKALHEIKKDFKKSGDPLTGLMLEEPDIDPAALSKISIPTLVLAGENDLVRQKETEAVASSIPNASLQILPGETHESYVIHSRKLMEFL